MTFQMIHLGHGQTTILEHPDFIDPTITVPKAPQHPVQRARQRYDRREAEEYAQTVKASQRRSYGLVSLVKARADQCKFIAGDDPICCGKKVTHRGSSWCEVHHGIVFSQRRQLSTHSANFAHKRPLQSAY